MSAPDQEGAVAEWEWRLSGSNGATVRVRARRARLGAFVDAYPAGTHDLELLADPRIRAADVERVTGQLLESNPRCRRVVLAVPEGDIAAIAWAEQAGYRYVVDVEVHSGAFALMVTEPDWVIAEPQVLDEIPLEE